MLNTGLNINNEFREQVEINMYQNFGYKKKISIKRVPRKENTCVISLLMFYEKRKNIILKVSSSVVYCITGYYVCDDYLCFTQTKLNVANK